MYTWFHLFTLTLITSYFHAYDAINCVICTYYFIFMAQMKSTDLYYWLIYTYYAEQFVYVLGFLTSISLPCLSPPVTLIMQGFAVYVSHNKLTWGDSLRSSSISAEASRISIASLYYPFLAAALVFYLSM